MSAVEQFNQLFGYHFTEPLDGHSRSVMIGFARDSGRPDVADRLEEEGKTETSALSLEPSAFPP